MSEYNSVNEEIRAQGAKTKNMSLPKRLGYYWHYYKWIVLGILAAALLVFFLVKSIVTDHKPPYLTGIFMNCSSPSGHEEELENAFAEYVGVDTSSYSVDFDFGLGYNLDDPTDSLSVYSPIKMISYSEGHTGDFFLCDAETFDFFAKSGYFADLSEILTEEQLSQYKAVLYYFDADDGRGSIPVAIRIADTEKLHSAGCYTGTDDDLLFALFYNSEQKERALTFLAFLSSESD